MDRLEVLTTVQEIVQDALGLDELELTFETTAADVERWDSVANIGIVMSIEQEYDFRFSLGELDTLDNVGAIVDAIIAHTG